MTAHAEAGNNCLSCHEPVITEQVGEVMKWTSDDYPMTADGTKLADGADMASEEFCAKSEDNARYFADFQSYLDK